MKVKISGLSITTDLVLDACVDVDGKADAWLEWCIAEDEVRDCYECDKVAEDAALKFIDEVVMPLLRPIKQEFIERMREAVSSIEIELEV